MSHFLWQLESVTLWGHGAPRLDEVTLAISPGTTAILGESGAGKTSLLNLLVGFESPDDGSLAFHPPETASLPISWAPVDGGLWPRLTVREHLDVAGLRSPLGRRIESESDAARASAVDEWLLAFHLDHLAERTPDLLSMGERSRLSVGRALACDAAVAVMDEPLAHVDSARLPHYWKILRSACALPERSLVFATHSAETVIREADQVICLDQGRLVWQGPVKQLYNSPPDARTAAFLGPINWLDESAHWWPEPLRGHSSLRPERLQIQADEQGDYLVRQARFAGSIAEAELEHRRSQQVRTIWHRPAGSFLSPGMTVALRAWLLAAVLLIPCLSGCRETAGDDQLSIETFDYYTVPTEAAMLPAPRGLTFSPSGEMYVLDDAGRVLVYGPDRKLVRQWWMPEYDIGKPEGVCILQDGRVAIADTHYHRVLFFTQQGELLGSLGEQGEGPGQFIYTVDVAQDPDGYLYVAEYGGNDRVQKFTVDGKYVTELGRAGTAPGEFQRASGVVWNDGIVYVADAINNRVHAFKDDGKFLGVIADAESTGLHYPYDITLSPEGTLYLAEFGANRITEITLEGELIGHFGTPGRGTGQFWTPWGIAVRSDGAVIVADTGNRRLVELKK